MEAKLKNTFSEKTEGSAWLLERAGRCEAFSRFGEREEKIFLARRLLVPITLGAEGQLQLQQSHDTE